jgi:hypothetical protein
MTQYSAELFATGFVSGVLTYQDAYPSQESAARIVVSIIVDNQIPIKAIVDTGAPWCVLDPEVAEFIISEETIYQPKDRLLLRGILYEGQLYRINYQLIAEIGESVDIEATVFVPQLRAGESWPHPNFIGLDGFLNRLRIAIDPAENALYFGPV